ncbi:MAG: hypothetical protein U0Z17_01225 [Bacteroidales bacterium]
MHVYCAVGGMCGISAQGSDQGTLWSTISRFFAIGNSAITGGDG